MLKVSRFALISVILAILAGCGGADERKAAYLEKGNQLFSEGNYEKARLEFKNALQIDPKDADAHYKLGLALEKLGEWKPALSQFLAVLKLDDAHVGALVHTGQIYLLGNALDQALENAEKAIAIDPEDPDALALRGGVRAKSGDIKGAFSDGQSALKKDPGHVNSIALLSALHLAQRESDKALALIDQGLKSHPENTNLLGLKAKVLMSQKKVDEAGEILEKIITIEPDQMVHRFQLAGFYSNQNKLDKAEKVLRDAAAYEKDDNKAKMVLIDFLAKKRGFEAAEKELLAEIEKHPDESVYQFGLAELYKTKDLNKSLKVLQKIAKDNTYGAPDGLKAKSKMATLYMQLRNFDEARKLAEEVLDESPKDTDALLVRSSLSLIDNKPTEAIADLRALISRDPTTAKYYRLLARAHLMNDEKELAREALEKAAELDPKDAVIRSELAEVLLKLGKPDLAIEQVQEVLDIAPDNEAALETLFKLQSAKNDWKAALATAKKIKEAFPEKAEGYHLSGLAHQMNKDFTASVDDYVKALEKAPDAIQPLVQLVRGYMAQNKVEEALARVNKVLENNPDNHVALTIKGEILASQGKLEQARAALNRAIEIRPDYRSAYISLARTYASEGKIDEVIKTYQSGLNALPNDPVLMNGLATAHDQAGHLEEAISVYNKVLEVNPKNLIAVNNLAMLYADRIKTNDALEKAKEYIKLLDDTKNPAYLDTVGWVHLIAGDYDRAVSVLERAIAGLPEEPVLQYHLGMAYFKQGKNLSQARKHLELAIKSNKDFPGRDEAERVLSELN